MFKMFPRNHFLRALTIFSVLSSKKVSSRSLNAKVRYLPSSDIRISPSVSTLKEPNMLFFKCFLVCSLRAHSHYHSNLSPLFVILCWHFLTCVIEKVTPVPWNLDTFSWNIIPSTVFVSCQLLWFYNHIFLKDCSAFCCWVKTHKQYRKKPPEAPILWWHLCRDLLGGLDLNLHRKQTVKPAINRALS